MLSADVVIVVRVQLDDITAKQIFKSILHVFMKTLVIVTVPCENDITVLSVHDGRTLVVVVVIVGISDPVYDATVLSESATSKL